MSANARRPAAAADDGFDSDSDSGSDYSVTQTQLAVSDGPLENEEDGVNPLVSRIGGRVAWLPTQSIPPDSVARCAHCDQQMELLVQIFAPLDDSPYDRIVLVWGCARTPCQSKGSGCIKAIRILSHNARWAAKLEKKRQRREQREAYKQKLVLEQKARDEEAEKRKKVNPFASAGKNAAAGGLGASLFGDSASPFSAAPVSETKAVSDDETKTAPTADANDESDSDDEEDQEEQLAEEMAIKASLETKQASWADQDWSRSAPAYEPAEYLTTFAEPSSSARSYDEQKRNKAQMQKLKQDGIQEVKGWEAETYESMMASGTDEVFERFVKRVGRHGKQLVRYEFGGTPLSFHAKGRAYDLLWPKTKTQVNGGGGQSRDYVSDKVAKCTRCGARRVSEMQLMPNLVNTLRPAKIRGGQDGDEPHKKRDAEAERRREIEEAIGHRLPGKPDADGITRDKVEETEVKQGILARRTGLRWNTAIVLVCEADCHEDAQSWSEEVVEVQFEQEK